VQFSRIEVLHNIEHQDTVKPVIEKGELPGIGLIDTNLALSMAVDNLVRDVDSHRCIVNAVSPRA
jgi:hypothetical protein